MASPTPTALLDLPIDILLMIFPYLDATSFLRLTSTCRAFHQPDLLHEPSYWSDALRSTFRVPNQPVVQHDGQRSYKLFKRMFTQSRIYTWGNNEKGCLGHSWEDAYAMAAVPPAMRRARAMRSRHVSWPAEMQGTEQLGVVSDLQCGGWSTSMLTAKGAVYCVGVMDGMWIERRQGRPAMQKTIIKPTALTYPPGFVSPTERYEPSTAIKQMSAGRSHVLGLADSGRIWTWQNIEHAAMNVKFFNHDVMENGKGGRGTVRKVVAGWNKSAALIDGTGIVLWDPLQRENSDSAIEDAALVLESAVVPKTGYRKRLERRGETDPYHLGEMVGEVQSFILLEHLLIFNTSLGKVFASRVFWDDNEQRITEPIELPLSNAASSDVDNTDIPQTSDKAPFATDVQGSFKRFAIFLTSGTVLTTDQDRILDFLTSRPGAPATWTQIPALQDKGVIALAFGDWHYHALHSPGYITSYGNEPQGCGALGLGGSGDPEGRLRGIRYRAMGGDGYLVPHGYAEGRRVWFEEQKKYWIKFLTSGGSNPAESAERIRMAIGSPDQRPQGEVSEWIEQEGRDWVSKHDLQEHDEDGLGPYFALSVAAAGWHSGALMLKNEKLADKIKEACEMPDPAVTVKEDEASGGGEQREDDSTTGQHSTTNTTTLPPSSSLITSATSTALDYGRWFLGLHPYSPAPVPPNNQPYVGAQSQIGDFRHYTRPINYGASPREGYNYVWSNDSFPRLRLSDGTEMPGEVDFHEWRYERPEWDLDAQGI